MKKGFSFWLGHAAALLLAAGMVISLPFAVAARDLGAVLFSAERMRSILENRLIETGFLDDFDRPDGGVGNDWQQITSGSIDVIIADGKAQVPGDPNDPYERQTGGISRPLQEGSRVTISARLYDSHVSWGGGVYIGNYLHDLTIWDDGSGNGFGVRIDRAQNTYPDVTISLIDSGSVLESYDVEAEPIYINGGSFDLVIVIEDSGTVTATIGHAPNPWETHVFATPVSIASSGQNFSWKAHRPRSGWSPRPPQRYPRLDNLRIIVSP
jgi:hypothetical protein